MLRNFVFGKRTHFPNQTWLRRSFSFSYHRHRRRRRSVEFKSLSGIRFLKFDNLLSRLVRPSEWTDLLYSTNGNLVVDTAAAAGKITRT